MSSKDGDMHDAVGPAARDKDEQLLVDLVLGQCDGPTAQDLRRRLAEDERFAARHREIQTALEALDRYDVPAPPVNLVERTLARVSAQRRSEGLLVERPTGRRAFAPTFSYREMAALAAGLLLIVGIFVPAMRQARRRANRSLCGASQGQIGTGLIHYANTNDGLLPAAPATGSGWLVASGPERSSNSAGLFLLVRSRYVSAETFQCPAAGGESFVARGGMTDFPSPKTIGYSYQHSLARPINREALADVADEMVILGDHTPFFAGGVYRRKDTGAISTNHGGSGQNALHLNSSVFWTRDNHVGVNGDNIFLADGITAYTGVEVPASPTDSFLLPSLGQ